MNKAKLSQANWLHLDLKGTIPARKKMLEWIEFYAQCGFNGIVFEYDDRIDWQSWPGTFRGGYSREDIREIHNLCRRLGLEIVPLIQIHGHLEWLLKHERYAHLRENNLISELCPLNMVGRKMIKDWIDEVSALHPDSQYIHLGADETWQLASCDQCKSAAAGDSRGKLGIYLDHVSDICRYASGKGLRPLIWADMFWREQQMALAAELPEEVILVDWQYGGQAPYKTFTELQQSGHELMGASGICVGWWEHASQVQIEPVARINNVIGWKNWADQVGFGMIHTTWGRAGSLWNIYGPMHGAVPVFIAAGNPAGWKMHPWNDFFTGLSDVMCRDTVDELLCNAEKVKNLAFADDQEKQCLEWWSLALRYQALEKKCRIIADGKRCLDKVIKYVGRDQECYSRNFIEPVAEMLQKIDQWEQDAKCFWSHNQLTDEEEFFDSHSNVLREQMNEIIE